MIKNPVRKLWKYLFDVDYRFRVNAGKFSCYKQMNDVAYLRRMFKAQMGYTPDLDNPRTFNEKLQWLKLHDHRPEYTTMVDKYAAKKYVADIIGEEYIISTIGVWEKAEDIDFASLPDQFVLKCTHDSGGRVLCKDKSTLDVKAVKKELGACLKRDYFYAYREWPYKDVKPRIIAEPFLIDPAQPDGLDDYKVHNFNGVPKFILVAKDRFTQQGVTQDFFDLNWKHLNMKRPEHPHALTEPKAPANLSKMLELSEKLSRGIPFIRTDFYEVNGKLYCGELTFFPLAGTGQFIPETWDEILGDWLTLPKEGD